MSAVETPPRLSLFRKIALFGAPAAVTVIAWYALPLVLERAVAPEPKPVAAAGPPDGARLFAQNCAYCHGARGDGRGVAALNPPARYFGAEKYKLACTTNGVPTDDDLLRVLRRGIPGTAMPSFGNLTEDELRALVAHVRTLTWRGLYDTLWKKAYDAGDDPDPAEIAARVDRMTTPGTPLPVPPIPPATQELVKLGEKVFASPDAGCVKCHGPLGKGDGLQVSDPNFKNENGTRARPRDLTAGVFKGGREPEQLYVRIWNGIPGTPMPEGKVALKPEQVVALVHFIRSLSPEPPVAVPGTPVLSAGR